MSEKKIVTLLDAVSRTVIGKRVGETEEYIDIENPAIVNIVPQTDPASGQQRMSLQLFPIFFKEFLADKNEPVVYRYKKANIALPVEDVVFDFRLQSQYEQLFSNIAIPQNAGVQPANAMPPKGVEPIKLFDD